MANLRFLYYSFKSPCGRDSLLSCCPCCGRVSRNTVDTEKEVRPEPLWHKPKRRFARKGGSVNSSFEKWVAKHIFLNHFIWTCFDPNCKLFRFQFLLVRKILTISISTFVDQKCKLFRFQHFLIRSVNLFDFNICWIRSVNYFEFKLFFIRSVKLRG